MTVVRLITIKDVNNVINAKVMLMPAVNAMAANSVIQPVRIVLVVRREIVQPVMSVIPPVIIILPLTLR